MDWDEPIVVEIPAGQPVQVRKVNIDETPDVFYSVRASARTRYKTRQFAIQYRGSGRMLRTFFLNLDDFAKDIRVSPDVICNYIGYYLQGKGTYNPKECPMDRAYVKGHPSIDTITKAVRDFISVYVLCVKCHLPETTMCTASISGKVQMKCASCGESYTVIPNSEKFSTYLAKHQSLLNKTLNE